MNKIIENSTKANYINYCKFWEEKSSGFTEYEFIKYYAKLCEYEKMYNKYHWGFGAFDNPDYF